MAEEYFKWTEFYSKFATKLLDYRNNRPELIRKIQKVYQKLGLKFPKLESDYNPKDIDPFTVFGLFNKNIKYQNRINIIRGMCSEFSIREELPESFEGIPVLNNLAATFYGFGGKRKEGDIDRLWNVFAAAIMLAGEDTPEHRTAFSNAYDAVIPQYGIKWNITMGLYWIRPYFFINLDKVNRDSLVEEGRMPEAVIAEIKPRLKKVPSASDYLKIRDLALQAMQSGDYPYHNFPEFSLYSFDPSSFDPVPIPDPKPVPVPDEVRYWIYAPGEGAEIWETCCQDGIAALGWHELGDLSQYGSREEIKQALKEQSGKDSDFPNDTLACWQYVHEMKPGDILFAKKGRSEILGMGTIKSEFFYDAEKYPEYPQIRRVDWTKKGSWQMSEALPIKTLTDITDNTSLRETILAQLEKEPDLPKGPEYGKEDFLEEVYLNEEEYDTLTELLARKKNVILQGPPGVGKTFAAKRLACSMMGVQDDSRVEMVQFHQSYSYEDFVMGFRPTAGGGFEIRTGAFYDFCKRAADDSGNKYFFIIDEINRGNLSKIFGELFMLIEGDKRGKEIRLLYSDELFYVPENLYLIGTMNTADRSLAMLDYALRRRFAFFDLKPAFSSQGFKAYQAGLHNEKMDNLIRTVESLNRSIADDESLGEGFCIGHSYFCSLSEQSLTDRTLSDIVEYELIPLLKEYWFDEPEKVQEWSGHLRSVLK